MGKWRGGPPNQNQTQKEHPYTLQIRPIFPSFWSRTLNHMRKIRQTLAVLQNERFEPGQVFYIVWNYLW